jgi:hypothetical protein
LLITEVLEFKFHSEFFFFSFFSGELLILPLCGTELIGGSIFDMFNSLLSRYVSVIKPLFSYKQVVEAEFNDDSVP